jgi:hypothetical protein
LQRLRMDLHLLHDVQIKTVLLLDSLLRVRECLDDPVPSVVSTELGHTLIPAGTYQYYASVGVGEVVGSKRHETLGKPVTHGKGRIEQTDKSNWSRATE